ncbi:MAG: hypothetical protein HY054_13305, partial [Proteobacteria bacterium]|nr:hypothetical protein [Pseudomonadota bacterium]
MAELDPVLRAPSSGDVVFHEDEWRQLEFFSQARLEEIQAKLRELNTFEAAHRVQSGWTQAYVRTLATAPVLSGADAAATLAHAMGSSLGPAPILFTGANSITGRVRNGFTVPIGHHAWLYGFHDNTGIPVLGATLQNADDQLLTSAFSRLHRSNRLLLVDWQSQMLLTGVTANGQIEVWSPRQR